MVCGKKIRHLKFTCNFGSDAPNYVKHHACLCNDLTSQLVFALDQLELIHDTTVINTPLSATTKKVRHTSWAWDLSIRAPFITNYRPNFLAMFLKDHPLPLHAVKKAKYWDVWAKNLLADMSSSVSSVTSSTSRFFHFWNSNPKKAICISTFKKEKQHSCYHSGHYPRNGMGRKWMILE